MADESYPELRDEARRAWHQMLADTNTTFASTEERDGWQDGYLAGRSVAAEAHRLEVARARVEAFITESDTFRERLTTAEAERDALAQQIAAVRALAAKWHRDILGYPTETDVGARYAFEAVKLCNRELLHILDQSPVTPESETNRRKSCVHCGMELTASIGDGLYGHVTGLQRCQSPDVPYGHMGHPSMPCPTGTINPCTGSYESECTHLPARHPESETN